MCGCNSVVECQPSKLFVAGSIPVTRSKFNAQVMELVYVLVLEAKFCEFESRPGHQ